jgi:hypothetical protein
MTGTINQNEIDPFDVQSRDMLQSSYKVFVLAIGLTE